MIWVPCACIFIVIRERMQNDNWASIDCSSGELAMESMNHDFCTDSQMVIPQIVFHAGDLAPEIPAPPASI